MFVPGGAWGTVDGEVDEFLRFDNVEQFINVRHDGEHHLMQWGRLSIAAIHLVSLDLALCHAELHVVIRV